MRDRDKDIHSVPEMFLFVFIPKRFKVKNVNPWLTVKSYFNEHWVLPFTTFPACLFPPCYGLQEGSGSRGKVERRE